MLEEDIMAFLSAQIKTGKKNRSKTKQQTNLANIKVLYIRKPISA